MKPFVDDPDFTLFVGDALEVLTAMPDAAAHAVVTSPPYLDARPEYDGPSVDEFALIFGELMRVCSGGMIWNVGRLWRGGVEQLWWLDLILAADDAGWRHADTAVWLKPNANPIRGNVLADSHEYVLLFDRPGVRFNVDAIRTEYAEGSLPRLRRRWIKGRGVKLDDRDSQDGRRVNELGARARSFFVAYVGREKGNPHPAPMALDLAHDLVELACEEGEIILDPFAGSGTTAFAARLHRRGSIAIEQRQEYAEWAAQRMSQLSLFAEGAA